MSWNDFLSILISSILLAGLYATMSYGMALIYGVMKIINLAHAGLLMLGAYASLTLWRAAHVDPFLSTLVVGPVFFLLGMAIQRFFVRRVPLSNVPTLPSLLLLFGLWLILQNSAYLIWSGDNQTITTSYVMKTIDLGGVIISVSRLMVFAIGGMILIFLQLFLTRTYVGKALRAVTQNRMAARLSGIGVERISMIAFGLGTALAGIAGAMSAALFSFSPDYGKEALLRAFVIIVLGGLESFSGVALGALVLALLEQFSVRFMPASYQPAVAYAALVLVLVAMPRGLGALLDRKGRRLA